MEFWNGQSYTYLRKKTQGRRALFEDDTFPPCDRSIWLDGKHHQPVEWKRPREICSNPQLVVGELHASKFSMGMLGNCWFVGACASLSQDRKTWNKVIPNWRDQNWDEQNAPQKYVGIFRFRLWIKGRTYEVVVDDRLPTVGNHLLFCQSTSTNEFWCALLEKACAKIAGCYEALGSGHIVDGLVHFTGGIANFVDLADGYRQDTEKKKALFKEMFDAYTDGSFMTCEMYIGSDKAGTELDCGLVKGHPYVITDVKTLKLSGSLKDYIRRDEVNLVRLAYPWGNKEWNGPWSDGSRELNSVSVDDIDFVDRYLNVSDGEFWMSFEDWLKWFDDLGIVYVINNKQHSLGRVWYQHKFSGKWVNDPKALTAGGCVNYPDTFLKNPQYCFTLDTDKTVVVSLEQTEWKAATENRETGEIEGGLRIGYHIMKSEDNRKYQMHTLHEKASSSAYTNRRSVFGKETFQAGSYVVVPTTYECDKEGEFILRICTESPIKCWELTRPLPVVPLWKYGMKCLYTPNALVLVTLEHGEGLRRLDSRGRGLDPYCVVSVAGQNERSSIRWNTRNPIWNSQVIAYTRNPWHKKLTIKVFGKQPEGRDTFIGRVMVRVPGTSYLVEARRYNLPLTNKGCQTGKLTEGRLQFIVTTSRDLYSV